MLEAGESLSEVASSRIENRRLPVNFALGDYDHPV